MPELQCPDDRRHPLELDPGISRFEPPFNGSLSCRNGHEYPVQNNIINLLPGQNIHAGSLANLSNHFSVTASYYEEQWRKKSIGILSGQEFSAEDEKQLLLEWTSGSRQPKKVLDIGTSTGFYARTFAAHAPGSENYALDTSLHMLQKAIENGKQNGEHFYPLRVDAAKLPFFDDQLDLLLCGGTYNELTEPETVLREMRRVLKPDGRFFIMYLTRASTIGGKAMQTGLWPGGIHFPKASEMEKQLSEAGFSIEKSRELGVVTFQLLM